VQKLAVLSAAVAMVCLTSVSALAQQGRAELRGQITDESGGALPGVNIVITNQDTGTVRELVTGAEGSYFAAQLNPGTFSINASLPGFGSFERTDFLLGVGRTLDLDIVLGVGGIEETVTVSGSSPLVDLTSAEVGGSLTASDLVEVPTANRSAFAAVALLPGIQFAPSSQLGNDTMIANGQTRGGNAMGVDGAANNDDISGSGAGGQVRIALESVAEVQVLLNQFDAEFGRVRGAIVNAITKRGTNQFSGAIFDYQTSEAMTAEDYFVARNDALTKPETNKKEFGGIIGGPIVPDKAHFFFSLERQIVNPSRSRDYTGIGRPELSFSLSEQWRAWNTLIRVDHQINPSNTWAVRWVREEAPQFNLVGSRDATLNTIGDETDNDQIFVGTYTSVLGSNKVNTLRIARTYESAYGANECWRANGGFDNIGSQVTCPPQWNQRSFQDNQRSNSGGRDDFNWQFSNTFSWFVPNMKGDHDFKFGGTQHRSVLNEFQEGNLNGTFNFAGDATFDPLNPSTFPERLAVRVGNPLGLPYEFPVYTTELFFQDKWQMTDRLTAGLGVRYDLEIFRADLLDGPGGITANPLLPPGEDPIDKNNISPRLSLAYDVTGDGRSVIRGGYGIYYDKTLIGTLDNFSQNPRFTDSFTAAFPASASDPGPGNGLLPTDPFLLNFGAVGEGARACPANPSGPCPFVDRVALDAMFPAGTLFQNTGNVFLDTPTRKQPYMHQMTLGYERELAPTLSASADYIRTMGRDMLARHDYNLPTRQGTGRNDPLVFHDVFGLLGGDGQFVDNVIVAGSVGDMNYDALNLQVEKRYADRWSARVSYTLSHSRGNTFEQYETIATQVGSDLNLDLFHQPAESDRRHLLALSGRTELPGGVTASAVLRYMSELPFTIHDTNFDPNRNGILFDPIAAGTYSGTGENALTNVENAGGYGGARGAAFMQLDVRVGYRVRPMASHTLDVFFDIFNITDHANFQNPTGDRRSGNFLRLTTLYGASGFPRQAQFGIRYGF
jgi:hypothetical protein